MKKLLSICVGVAGLFSTAFAQEATTFVVNGTTYSVTGEATVCVSEVDTDAEEIVIPETVSDSGVSYTVTAVGERAFNYAAATKIVLANTITDIAYCGIYNTKATSIQLPSGLRTLGGSALAYNRELLELTVPEGVTVIPVSCFANNQKMTKLNLPPTVEVVENGAFYKVPFSRFVVPEKCRKIGNNVFQLAPNLEEVVLNANIEELGDGAFRECVNLKKINLESATGLKEIPDNCFVECSALADVTIPASVEKIGICAFGNTSVVEYKVSADNKLFVADQGVVYAADKSVLWLYPPKKVGDSFEVPKGVRGIGGGAFYGSSVKKIALPESIVAIDSFAFCEAALAEINLPESILQIGEQAFAGTQLKSLELPEKIVAVYDGLAAWSKQLTSVVIPADVRLLQNHAFQNCSALTSVTCKGGVAPEVATYWDEEDNPFGYIERNDVTLHIPQGSLQSYQEMGWGDLFSNIVESEPAVLVPTATDPVADSAVERLEKIRLTFAEDVVVEASAPAVVVRKTNELVGDEVAPDAQWTAVNLSTSKKEVVLSPTDGHGNILPLVLEKDVPYFVLIPAGIFKVSSGATNQKILIELQGAAAVVEMKPESVTPASGSGISDLGVVEVAFAEKATVVEENPQVILRKNSGSDGEEISPEGGWIAAGSDNGQTVTVSPVSAGGQVSKLALESGVNYYLSIPAGVFRGESGALSGEIQLAYVGKADSSVGKLDASQCFVYASEGVVHVSVRDFGMSVVSVYDLSGRCVAEGQTSDHIEFGVQSAGVYVVRVVSGAETLVFKVKN